MKIISWNTAGRKKRQQEQVDYWMPVNADIICLQEVIQSTLPVFRGALEERGYTVSDSSFSDRSLHTGARKYCVLIATKWSHRVIPSSIPWSEKFLAVETAYKSKKMEIMTTHIPPGSTNGWAKIETFEAIYAHIQQRPSAIPKIICGDWNSPQAEYPDGRVVSWGETIRDDGRILVKNRKGQQDRWDRGEHLLLTQLSEFNMHDVYRKLNGYEKQEFSWFPPGSGGKKSGRRFDHIYANESLCPTQCFYDHSVRETKLSDHSALVAEFGR